MTAPFIPAALLFCTGRGEDHVVCHDQHRRVMWPEFASRVAGLVGELEPRIEQRWLVNCRHPLDGVAALFALLHCGKRAVMPQNFLPGTSAALRPAYDAVIGDDPAATLHPRASGAQRPRFEALGAHSACIDLFTSGSSGVPKRIEKSLHQLDAEVRVLESCWGATLGDAAIAATVPHHHIYGLLFRLLWPLAAGRAFDATTCTEPTTLLQRVAALGDAAIVSSPAHLARLPSLLDLRALAPATRRVFSSGGPLSRTIAQHYERLLGSAPVEIYGSTETGGIAWRCQGERSEGELWTPLPGVEVRVGDTGALCLRSPFLAEDRWTTLDDGGSMRASGCFVLGDRLDRVVKIEGKRISLPEVEQRLREHPWVLDAGVVRLSARKEALGAAIVLQAAAKGELDSARRSALMQTFSRFLRNWYEPVLIPRHWRFLDRLPENERGKVASADLARVFEVAGR